MEVPHGRSAVNRTFGNPNERGFYSKNIKRFTLPFPMRLAWDTSTEVKSVVAHKLVIPQLHDALEEIWNINRKEVKKCFGYDLTTPEYDVLTLERVQDYGLDLYGGIYNHRTVRGGRSLSTHAYGIAIDLNPSENRLGTTGNMPDYVVRAFESRGFFWGGRWERRPDPMHFQFATGV